MAAHRGRHKKRAAAEAALDEPDPQDGHNEGPASVRMPGPSLITGVLQEWALGTVSAPRLQKLVHQAYNDQVQLLHSLGLSADHIHPDLKALAQLGNWGKSQQHIAEALLNWLGAPCAPTTFVAKIPLKTLKGSGDEVGTRTDVDFPLLLPHVCFAHAWQESRSRFDAVFFGNMDGETSRKAFWQELGSG